MPDGPRASPPLPVEVALSSDRAFDSLYDNEIRSLSKQHWTPVRVASHAARLLTEAGAKRILDVGSGAGKFCIVGALSTSAEFVGVERRDRLVTVARAVALRMAATRATFVHASLDDVSFEGFDGVYLYNPFFEQVTELPAQIDDALEHTATAYRHFVQSTIEKLRGLPSAAAVVTFHGFGGDMPREFALKKDDPAGNDWLELWIKD